MVVFSDEALLNKLSNSCFLSFLKSMMVLSNHLYAHKCHGRYLLPDNLNGILFANKIQFKELQAFLAYQKNSTKFHF